MSFKKKVYEKWLKFLFLLYFFPCVLTCFLIYSRTKNLPQDLEFSSQTYAVDIGIRISVLGYLIC